MNRGASRDRMLNIAIGLRERANECALGSIPTSMTLVHRSDLRDMAGQIEAIVSEGSSIIRDAAELATNLTKDMTAARRFKAGDVVKLRSGGCPMTVEFVESATTPDLSDSVHCVWSSWSNRLDDQVDIREQVIHERKFAAELLVIYSPIDMRVDNRVAEDRRP